MGTINMFQLPCSPPKNFMPLLFPHYPILTFFFFLTSILDFPHFFLFPLCHLLLVIPHPPAPLPQAEQASLSHVVDLLSLILLTAIWAVCPRDSLALLGQWVQDKLSQVRPRMLPVYSV